MSETTETTDATTRDARPTRRRGHAGNDTAEQPAKPTSLAERLEREGDVAADYIEELLDIADLDGDIDMDVEGERAMVSLVGGNLDHLVGTEGAVVDALQELTRLAVLQRDRRAQQADARHRRVAAG